LAVASEKKEVLSSENYKRVSVIIPVRNEIEFVKTIVGDLIGQSYPANFYEVLFIDDHSEDGTFEYLTIICSEKSNFKVLSLENHQTGKKQAIDRGVEIASGEWIIQSDGDCRIPEDFITEHVTKAVQSGASLISGPVMLKSEKGLWSRIESLEFLSLAGTGMASVMIGKPVMCNGANLSYSKEFYLKVRLNLLENPTPSGDDIFLMTEAKRQQRKVEFLYSSWSIVSSEPTGSIRDFLNQRIRWGSKSRYYKDANLIYLSLLVWLVNSLLTVCLIGSLFNSDLFRIFFSSLGIKSLVDFWILFLCAKFFRQKSLLWLFPVTAIFYYFYITLSGVFSMLGSFSWKGRAYS
jgi:cellulose synthase/poly-beta-1,6-N-acetylglucosamine synthase-like glycosyltransferase